MIYGLAACGRAGFDDPQDAPAAADAPPDAAPDGPTPDAAFPDGPFGSARLVLELSDPAQEDDPTLTDDMLEIYFASTRVTGQAGNADIWRSTRVKVTDAWSAPALVTELNTTRNDENPGISGDGLTIWFSSNRDSMTDIYVSSRGNRAQLWSTPVRVAELSTAADDLGAEPARSQLRIALYGDLPRRLFEASRPSVTAAWTTPTPIDSLNAADSDNLSGFFVSDLELWFTSTRAGGAGQHDLYRAVRPSVSAPFGTPTPVLGINTKFRDDDAWLSPDGHTLYFTSTITGNQEIYVAERP